MRGGSGGHDRGRAASEKGGSRGDSASSRSKAPKAGASPGSSGVRSSGKGGRGNGASGKESKEDRSKKAGGKGGGDGRAVKGKPRDENTRPGSTKGSRSSGELDRKHKRPSASDGAQRVQGRGRASSGKPGRAAPQGRGRGESGSRGRHVGDGDGDKDTEGIAMPSNKKRRLKMERQQHRPEFNTVLQSKKIWNKLRERKVPEAECAKLEQELLKLIRGKVLNIAMKHDASRVVQTAIQFGSETDRLSILSEVEGHLVELSQLTYAHFITLRLLKDSRKSAELQKRVAKELRGHAVRLATHAVGARVIQAALDTLPTSATALIKAEFYGKEFALFDDGHQPHSLKGVLEARPDRRRVVMEHVQGIIGRLVAKGLMEFEFAHDLMWEYMKEATPAQMQELVPQLLESFMALLSTRAGSMAGAMCAAYGGAKERKRLMRALKGYVASSLVHRDAYIAVIRLVESVDDTITCQKTILEELLKPMEGSPDAIKGVTGPGKGTTAEAWVPRGMVKPSAVKGTGGVNGAEGGDDELKDGEGVGDPMEVEEGKEGEGEVEEDGEDGASLEKGEEEPPTALVAIMSHRNGCKLLLRLLAPDHTGYFHPEELEVLKPTMVPAPAGAKAADSGGASAGGADAMDKASANGEGTAQLVPSSKKDAAVRRRELLAYLREPLREACVTNAGALMRSKFAGSLVLLEALQVMGTPQLVQAVVEAVCAKPAGDQQPIYEDPAGHLFMKQLLKREAEAQAKGEAEGGGAERGDTARSNPAFFADALVEHLGESLVSWASSNRGAFVLSELVQVPSVKTTVEKVLCVADARTSIVEAASKEQPRNTGAKVLAEKLGFGSFKEGAEEGSTKPVKTKKGRKQA